MKQLEGIRYTKDATGHNRYVRIDLNRYGNHELLEDFLDGLEAEAQKGEPTISLREFLKIQNEKRGLNV
jgi:hypothetical protein